MYITCISIYIYIHYVLQCILGRLESVSALRILRTTSESWYSFHKSTSTVPSDVAAHDTIVPTIVPHLSLWRGVRLIRKAPHRRTTVGEARNIYIYIHIQYHGYVS